MKKDKGVTTLLFLLAFLIFSSRELFAQGQSDILKKGSLETREGILLLHLKGSPYEMGYQHGFYLKERIRVVWEDYFLGYLNEKTKSTWQRTLVYHLFLHHARQLERFIPQEYKEELQGIADGSGLKYEQVLLMHTFLDTVSLPRLFSKRDFKSCINFVVEDNATKDRILLHGRNLSWPSKGVLEKEAVLIIYQPDKGNSFAALSWAGIAGVLTAMNEKGVSLGETSVSSIESSRIGIPAFFLFRRAIQYSDSLYDAIRIISSSTRTTGYTVTLTDGKLDEAAVVEFSSKHYTVRFPQNNSLVITNHYLDPLLFETMKPLYPDKKLEETGSYQHLMRMQQLIEENFSQIDKEMAIKFLRDDAIVTSKTLHSVVFLPQELKLWVAQGTVPSSKGNFVEFDLAKELKINLPTKKESSDPFEFYHYEKKDFVYQMHLLEETDKFRHYEFSYQSVAPTEFKDRNVYVDYFEPKGRDKFPAVIVLPHVAGGTMVIEGAFCKNLADNGVAALMLQMPHQKTKEGRKWAKRIIREEPFDKITTLFRQIVIEASRGVDWLELQPHVDKDNLGIMGISLGAVMAPIATGLDKRIKAAVYILGGGDLSEIIYEGEELLIFRERLLKERIQKEDLERRFSLIDPLTFAFKAKATPTLMINAIYDQAVPREATLALKNALENPLYYQLPTGHYTSLLFIGFAQMKTKDFFINTLDKEKSKLAKKARTYLSVTDHAQLNQENFLRSNWKFTASAKYTETSQSLSMGILSEDTFHMPFFNGMDLSGRWEGDERYNLKGEALDLYTGIRFSQPTKVSLKFYAENVEVYHLSDESPSDLRDCLGNNKANILSLNWERSTLDEPHYPLRGTYNSLSLEYALKSLGSDYDFSRYTFNSRTYFTPGKFFTYVLRLKIGWMEEFDDNPDTPFFERFYAGGTTTIRGYHSRRVGPLDGLGLPLGGNFLFLLNLETRFPIYKKLCGAIFFDTGSTWSRINEVGLDDFRSGIGFGLRYLTKWGVARLDYGFKLNNVSGESKSRLHATFGIPF